MLSYRASIPLSNHTLIRLAGLIRAQRAERGCRWRRLDPAQQALLVLAHLRNGDTYARLAAGVPVHVVAARLGHADPSVTLRVYAHVIRAAEASAADIFAESVGEEEEGACQQRC